MAKAQPDLNALLKHFDEELSARLASLVNEETLEVGHIVELVRLTSKCPEYRDAEELDSVLEDAEEMDVPAFKTWVDDLIAKESE